MQCNFIFKHFVSSSLFFFEVVVKIFDYFGKPNSPFSKFCVNCLLRFYFVYCNNCVFNDVNRAARWWPCACLKCVFGLRRLEKTLNFLRCIDVIDLVLKYGSGIIEGNWLQLLFYFIVLMGIVAYVFGMSFFSCVSGFRLKFSGIAILRECLQLDSKSDLTTSGLILRFFDEKWLLSLTSYL